MKCKDCNKEGCPHRCYFDDAECVYQWTAKVFDWQSFRAEAAKDILCAMINHFGTSNIDMNDVVKWTDSLISKLKEKEEK